MNLDWDKKNRCREDDAWLPLIALACSMIDLFVVY